MKKSLLICALFAASSAQADVFSVDVPALQQEGKVVIKQLATTLGGELKKAKQSGGANAAIAVCNTKASGLTASVAEQNGWEIGRTSEKLRNPDNAPDDWEKSVLEKFNSQARIGANLNQMQFSQVLVEEDGRKVFRMMKAIPTGQQCLACHGDNVKPAIYQQIKSLYPEDKAVGFKEGELRGAFTLKKYL